MLKFKNHPNDRLAVERNYCIRTAQHHNRTDVLIGIFYKNGVLDESVRNCGISYLLDALFYEYLCANGVEVIHLVTNYGFSEILVKTHSDEDESIAKAIIDILLQCTFNADDIECLQAHISGLPPTTSWDVKYDQIRYPGTRLAYPVRGMQCTLDSLTLNDILLWRKRYIDTSKLYFCVSGAVSSELEQFILNLADVSCQPQCISHQVVEPFPLQQLQTERLSNSIVLSYPVAGDCFDLVQFDALCELIRLSCAKTLRNYRSSIHYPMLITDPVMEFRIRFDCTLQSASDLECAIHSDILNVLGCLTPLNLKRIKRRLNRVYTSLRNDLFEWTCFVGWNMVMGPWCNVDELYNNPRYLDIITPDTLAYTFACQSWEKTAVWL